MKFYVRGGVGDFLQTLWFISNNPKEEYILHTHFKDAKNFFASFNVNNTDPYIFESIEQHDMQVDEILKNHGDNSNKNIREVPRAYYSSVSFDPKIQEEADYIVKTFSSEKPIIGIHPFGSKFSFKVHSDFNLPVKFIPSDAVKELISNKNNYLLYGAKSELEKYGIEESDNIKFVCFDSILKSLATISHCCKFLGVDSCFKTLSANAKIPTFVMLGDFKDDIRDSMFIDQYEKDGVMKVFRYTDFDQQRGEILNAMKTFISEG